MLWVRPNSREIIRSKLLEIRESVSIDRKRLDAESHLSRGLEFLTQKLTDRQAAIEEFELALKFFNELDDPHLEGLILTNLGWANFESGNYERAIAAYTKATLIFQKIKDRIGEGKTTHGIGLVYYSIYANERARIFYERALAIKQETGDERGQGSTPDRYGKPLFSIKSVR